MNKITMMNINLMLKDTVKPISKKDTDINKLDELRRKTYDLFLEQDCYSSRELSQLLGGKNVRSILRPLTDAGLVVYNTLEKSNRGGIYRLVK